MLQVRWSLKFQQQDLMMLHGSSVLPAMQNHPSTAWSLVTQMFRGSPGYQLCRAALTDTPGRGERHSQTLPMGDVFIFSVVALRMWNEPLPSRHSDAIARLPRASKWVITAHQAPRERERTQKGHFSPQQTAEYVQFVVFINGLGFKVLKVSWAGHHLSCCADLRNQLCVTSLTNSWENQIYSTYRGLSSVSADKLLPVSLILP